MARKERKTSKELNYKIERINLPMRRDELDEICSELTSDDDFVNHLLEVVEETNKKYYITIMNDEFKSPKKNSTEERSYGFMKNEDAVEFLNEYIDSGKANSKPKEVMRTGYNKRSKDKYNELVIKEAEETSIINEFTKPSFDDVMDNIYVNVYNGETYHENEDELPDDLRANVGVIIPGMIETTEEYFEFVKRLKDKGKNGLGRSIYDRYEDYLDAVDLIDKYKQALYDKYGGKEEFFEAKELGGMFGAYEYYPMVKPRFKKNQRNMKLDKGINLNELANVKDMGARIRAEYSDEIDSYDVDDKFVEYLETPMKFRDLPEDLALMYKNDVNGNNGFDVTDKFKSIEKYAAMLRASKDGDEAGEGYRLMDAIARDRYAEVPIYDLEYVDLIDDLTSDENVIEQIVYDKALYLHDYDMYEADKEINTKSSFEAYKNFMKERLKVTGGLHGNEMLDNVFIEDTATYATRYMFEPTFKRIEDNKAEMNAAGDVLYRGNSNMTAFGKEKEVIRDGESRIQKYIRELSGEVNSALANIDSNADTSGYSNTMSIDDATSYRGSSIDIGMANFEMVGEPEKAFRHMVENQDFARRIYEVGADKDSDDMFSMRTRVDEFVNKAKESTKPLVNNDVLNTILKSNKRGVVIDE